VRFGNEMSLEDVFIEGGVLFCTGIDDVAVSVPDFVAGLIMVMLLDVHLATTYRELQRATHPFQIIDRFSKYSYIFFYYASI
jgi:hypothetical protein